MLSSDASLGIRATDDGRRAAGGGRTQVPGFLVHLVAFVFTIIFCAFLAQCNNK
jgi:hypothetical protein